MFGEQYDEEEAESAAAKEKGGAAAQKRKAAAELAATEAQEYNWVQLADAGKVRMLSTLWELLIFYGLCSFKLVITSLRYCEVLIVDIVQSGIVEKGDFESLKHLSMFRAK